MARKDFTFTSKVLMTLLLMGDTFLVTPSELKRRAWKGNLLGDNKNFYSMVCYLANKGLIRYIDKNNERFIKLTKHGELEALLAKARTADKQIQWDQTWRLIIFDIPEESHEKRHFFRHLLKRNGWRQLQQSVYINPYPLNREAIRYLQETKLISYIRIMKVQEMDNDKDLRKLFKLK